MAKFNYRMQNILQLKEKMEEQERNNFAARRRALTEEEEKLQALIDKRNAVAEEGRRLRQTVIDVRSIRENEDMQRFTEEQVKQQRIKVRVAEKSLDAARIKMQEAVQERKIHEKMREKAFERFIAEMNAAEVKEIDELTSYVYGTKDPVDTE
ncbi:MAG: flagellar export protein FliJ [Lachnospiraceae bacterium]|nr:flagellar export protein FliJ [Lachnospiraceae bacterium]MBR3737066.1 flagellar export protein FliJ [Lachnospiraceae bacterium]